MARSELMAGEGQDLRTYCLPRTRKHICCSRIVQTQSSLEKFEDVLKTVDGQLRSDLDSNKSKQQVHESWSFVPF